MITQDMPTLTQQYEATTQLVAELTPLVAALGLRMEHLEAGATVLADESDRASSLTDEQSLELLEKKRALIDEHDTTFNQSCEATLWLRDVEGLAIALKGEISRLTDEGNSSVATQDMPALTQSYEAAIARVAELVERVTALDSRINQIEEEGKGFAEESITRRALSDEYQDVMSGLCLARFRLDGAKKLVADLLGGIELLDKCLTPRKRSAVETYLCDSTFENLATAQVENSELLALMKAALAASE